MAESHNTLAKYKAELDRICASVMPDKWVGHGRLKIDERAFENPEKAEFAQRLLEKLNDKHPEIDAEMLAEKSIEATEKKFD